MALKPISDTFLEPLNDITKEQAGMVLKGADTADASATGNLHYGAENFCIAVDESGKPGFLLYIYFNEEAPPSAHFKTSLLQDIPSSKFIPHARAEIVNPETSDLVDGPALLVFIPGLDTFHIKTEAIFRHVWG